LERPNATQDRDSHFATVGPFGLPSQVVRRCVYAVCDVLELFGVDVDVWFHPFRLRVDIYHGWELFWLFPLKV
jgi:hypothetical protein